MDKRSRRIANPFLVYGYEGPHYFCDREEETRKLVSALENGRNVTLAAPRRIGKTGLIHNVFHQVRNSGDDIICIYVDIFPTRCLADFAPENLPIPHIGWNELELNKPCKLLEKGGK